MTQCKFIVVYLVQGRCSVFQSASTLCLTWVNKFETKKNNRNFGFNNKQAGRNTLPVKAEINCNNERNVAFLELRWSQIEHTCLCDRFNFSDASSMIDQ